MGQPHERIVGGDEVDPKYSIPFQVTPPVRLNLRAVKTLGNLVPFIFNPLKRHHSQGYLYSQFFFLEHQA